MKCVDAELLFNEYNTNNQTYISSLDAISSLYSDLISSLYHNAPLDCHFPYKNWFIEKLFEKYNLSSSNKINKDQLSKIINDMDMKVEEAALGNQIDEMLLGQPKSGSVEIYQKVLNFKYDFSLKKKI